MDVKIDKKVLAISGSTRTGSSNMILLKTMASFAGNIDFIYYEELAELPHFNPDLDKGDIPIQVQHFRDLIAESDGVIICTPEYIFSLPGALKNALEWMVSTIIFKDKPVAMITAAASGEKAHESLKLIMQTIQARIIPASSLLIQGVRGKIKNGNLIHEETRSQLKGVVNSLIHEMMTG